MRGQTAELRDHPCRREVPGDLQLHGTQDAEVFFKDIEILNNRE
jgi:hypothetical protein